MWKAFIFRAHNCAVLGVANMRGRRRLISGFCFVLLLAQLGLVFSANFVSGNSTHYDFLIVTHEDFLDELRPLADWKTRTGMPTALVSWQEYNRYGGWGVDEAERIKYGIKLAHETYGVQYVLLVGDSDLFPVRYTMTDRETNDTADTWGYGAYFASDLYYADLYKQDGSFDNWDYNGNHVYGELHGEYFTNDYVNIDRIDMIPDVAVGRLPAMTQLQVENYVAKVINYETNTRGSFRSGTTREWFKTALFIIPYTPDDDLDVIFKGGKENIAEDYLTDARGFQIIRLYDPRLAAGAPTGTNGTPTQDLIKWWLAAGVGFVNYGGHGNRDWWSSVFNKWVVDDPTFGNPRQPIMLSVGCGTAQFAVQPPYETYVDVTGHTHLGINNGELWPITLTLPAPACLQTDIHDSFPEHMLCQSEVKGAVGYVGCVTGAQAWSKYLDEFFYQGYGEGVKLGDMWANMVTQYCDSTKTLDSQWSLGQIGRGETSIRSNGDWMMVAGYHQPMKFGLFGDPSLRVGGLTNRPPAATVASLPDLAIGEGTRYTFNLGDIGFRDPEASPLSYRWDVNGDDAWDTDWTASSTVSHTYSDDFIGEVKFQASDGIYQSEVCTRLIRVVNVAPTVSVDTGLPFGTGPRPSYRVEEGKEVRFRPIVDDPGTDTFTYSWDFGEGATPRTSTQQNPEVTFEGPEVTSFMFESVIRSYNVTVTARDDDGGVGTHRLTMEVVHVGVFDKLGGILGLMGISVAVIAGVIGTVLIRREVLRRRVGRESQRPL